MGLAPPPPLPPPWERQLITEKAWWSPPWFFFHPLLKTLQLLKVVNDTLIKCFLGPVTVQSPMSEVHNYLPLFFFNFLAVKGSLDSWLKLNHRLKLHLVFYVKPTTTTVVWNTVLQVVRYPFSMNPAVVCGKDTKEIVSCFTGDRWGEYDHQNTCHGWFS